MLQFTQVILTKLIYKFYNCATGCPTKHGRSFTFDASFSFEFILNIQSSFTITCMILETIIWDFQNVVSFFCAANIPVILKAQKDRPHFGSLYRRIL